MWQPLRDDFNDLGHFDNRERTLAHRQEAAHAALMRFVLRDEPNMEPTMEQPLTPESWTSGSCRIDENQSMAPVPVPTTPAIHSTIVEEKDEKKDGKNNEASNVETMATPRLYCNKEYFDPGLFARERNPRRNATKLFREPPSPGIKTQPRPKPSTFSKPSTTLNSPNRSTSTTRSISPTATEPDLSEGMAGSGKKRKSQRDYVWPSERRRKSRKSHAEPTLESESKSKSKSKSKTSIEQHSRAVDEGGAPAEHRSHATTPESTESLTAGPVQPKSSSFDQHVTPLDRGSTVKTSTAPDAQNIESTPELSPEPSVASEEGDQQSISPSEDQQGLDMPETPPMSTNESDESTIASPQGPERMVPPSSEYGNIGNTFNPFRRPARDNVGFVKFVDQMKILLQEKSQTDPPTVGTRQAQRILALLEVAKPPERRDAAFVTGPEASGLVNHGWPAIIITEGQQLLPLQTVDQFLDEHYNDRTRVSIQDPAYLLTRNKPAVREVTMHQIKKRFAATTPSNNPWNLLELATHADDGLRPAFLNTEDCRLLTKLKIPNSIRDARRRTYQPGYKEVEKWALVAQAGALTEPHQDSHGYNTFITVNAGLIGFGWLSRPTPAERAEWCANPHTMVGGSWRYVVLHPGQTVYFPSGTVHFVFRHRDIGGNSLAFGGHVLRCADLTGWVRTMLEEREFTAITNEDLTTSAPGYLAQVERFVLPALRSGDPDRMDKWGGEEEIEEFLRLKKEFLALNKESPGL